jgi:carbon-monoxide dehydrogenase small subunit
MGAGREVRGVLGVDEWEESVLLPDGDRGCGGKTILTIEGLAKGRSCILCSRRLWMPAAFQCGFCTPGMIMSAVQLLAEKPKASSEEINSWMSRNICRCCSYASIHQAVASASGAKEAGHV